MFRLFHVIRFVLYNGQSMSWPLEIAIEPRYARERRPAMAVRWRQ